MSAEPVKRGVEVKLPSPSEEINDSRIVRYGVRLYLKRDDLIHPEIPGNKWRKFKYNLLAAREQGYRTILTYGGAYSKPYSSDGCGRISLRILDDWHTKAIVSSQTDLDYLM
jgi:hypothetical protein